MQPEKQDTPETAVQLEASSVLEFLTTNPDFFNQHAEVLPRLNIPHEAGGAISLIEKQVSVLRSKCNHLETSLHDLINVARENERLHLRLHRLIQDMVSADTLTNLVSITRDSLIDNFKADDVRFFLNLDSELGKNVEKTFIRQPCDNYYLLSSRDPVFDVFKQAFTDEETFCGPLGDEQRALLCTGCATELASAALIPLRFSGKSGFVVMGSSDASRFAAGKGVMFLNQLGEVLSRRVQSFTQTKADAVPEEKESADEVVEEVLNKELENA